MVVSLKKVPHLHGGPTRMYKRRKQKEETKVFHTLMRVNYLNLSKINLEHLYIYILLSVAPSRLQCALALFRLNNEINRTEKSYYFRKI